MLPLALAGRKGYGTMSAHSYEEIRAIAVELLSGRVRGQFANNQIGHLKINIAECLAKRGAQSSPSQAGYRGEPRLSGMDDQLADEVFWDLFRQGIVMLGLDAHNQGLPWFRVTSFGQKILQQGEPYFFHDLSSYEAAIRKAVPAIDDTILLYAKEAKQAYMSGCLLSATVMIGVATEGSFLKLLDTIEQHPTWSQPFKSVFEQKTVLQKLKKFLNIAEQQLMKSLPGSLKENFDTEFAGIMNMIRNARNEAGHPSGKIISREECFVLLRLFIPCAKKIHDLMQFFPGSGAVGSTE